MSWPSNTVTLSGGQWMTAGYTFLTGRELLTNTAGAWAVIDATPGTAGSSPIHLTSAFGYAFYAATGVGALWVAQGASARAVATSVAITNVRGIASFSNAIVVAAGSPASLLSVSIVPAMASDGASDAAVVDLLNGAGITGVSKPVACSSGLFFYGSHSGTRQLWHVATLAHAPVSVYASAEPAGVPACVSLGVAFVDGGGAVRVRLNADASTVVVASPAFGYTNVSALTWVWAGVCFSAVTQPGTPPEIICAGTPGGDFSLVTRSSAVGVSLPSEVGYMLGFGRSVFTGCFIAGVGPHLCAYNAVAGSLCWSSKDDPRGLALSYNAFGLVGNTLVFAAEAAGHGKATLWELGL